MPLSAGTRLGPYEILSPLGAGGMGEVYRARDPRLNREVAVKVLPRDFLEGEERKARFEREARILASLNHPGIAAIYTFEEIPGSPIPGSPSTVPVLVMELLEGETLRSELARGKLSPRRAIDYAVQIANGLAAAHEKGIVHRDLKPENLVVTKDGRVKILDFGLAKLIQPDARPGEETSAPTATPGTEPGVVMGTVGYMSPEQVRGRPADARSDIFSFGAILYEMLTGRRAFQGDSAADTMSAILKEDPPDLTVANQNVSPGLERIVRHCLEKNPERRFQSARDLGFALETGPSSVAGGAAVAPAGARKLPVLPILLALAILAIPVAAILARRSARSTVPVFQRLSFRRGNVLQAMFTPDAASVIYAAAWEGDPAEVFTTRIDGTDSRPLGLKNANVVGVSSRGEIAVLRKSSNTRITGGEGTLATVSLSGGEPRDVLDRVVAADWNPEGTQMAIARQRRPTAAAGVWVPDEWTVEFPIGHVLYRTSTFIRSFLRFSPDGLRLAFSEGFGKTNTVKVLDLSGHVKTLGEGDGFRGSLAWWHGGKEIVTASNPSSQESRIESVDLEGHRRLLYRLPGTTFLQDVSRDGRLLVAFVKTRQDLAFGSADLAAERNLGWLSSSGLVDLSSDCRQVLFEDALSIPGKAPLIFLRGTDGSPAVHLGDAFALGLSPDGRWVLTIESPSSKRFTLLPTGAGEPTTVPFGDLEVWGARFLSDGESIGFVAVGRDGAEHAYVVSRRGGPPHLIASATSSALFSPDGKAMATYMATYDGKGNILIYPIEGGQPRAIPGLVPGDSLVQWSRDGWIYVRKLGQTPALVERFEIASGRKEAWRTMMPADASGVIAIGGIALTRDARCWAYSFNRALSSDLYMISGLD